MVFISQLWIYREEKERKDKESQRKKRKREKREGPWFIPFYGSPGACLLCKLDLSHSFVHSCSASPSPESEAGVGAKHESQGRAGTWLRTALPQLHKTLSSNHTLNVWDKTCSGLILYNAPSISLQMKPNWVGELINWRVAGLLEVFKRCVDVALGEMVRWQHSSAVLTLDLMIL